MKYPIMTFLVQYSLEKNGFSATRSCDSAKYQTVTPMGGLKYLRRCAACGRRESSREERLFFASTEASLRIWEHLRYHTAYPVEYLLEYY